MNRDNNIPLKGSHSKDILELSDLQKGMPGISPIQGAFLQENAIVALHKANHLSPAKMTLTGIANKDIELAWTDSVNQQMLNSYNDERENAEFAAAGISALLTPYLTDYTIISRARIGWGFDFWLGQENSPLFMAVLEVTGMNKETQHNSMTKRIAEKRSQVRASDILKLPQYISVVELSTPKAHYELVKIDDNDK